MGIDNIRFTVGDANCGGNGRGASPIPLPAAGRMPLAGLGAPGAAARRRA